MHLVQAREKMGQDSVATSIYVTSNIANGVECPGNTSLTTKTHTGENSTSFYQRRFVETIDGKARLHLIFKNQLK